VGLEPTTRGLKGRCSNHLSYGPSSESTADLRTFKPVKSTCGLKSSPLNFAKYCTAEFGKIGSNPGRI
jgi:hypothetical protein